MGDRWRRISMTQSNAAQWEERESSRSLLCALKDQIVAFFIRSTCQNHNISRHDRLPRNMIRSKLNMRNVRLEMNSSGKIGTMTTAYGTRNILFACWCIWELIGHETLFKKISSRNNSHRRTGELFRKFSHGAYIQST